MRLVSPEHFDAAQKVLVETFKESVRTISSQTDVVLGVKDIHSRHLSATDAFARLVGLSCGLDVAGRTDRDMPCEGTAQFADCYVREDQELLRQPDLHQKKSILNVHEYSHGIDALVFEKYALKQVATESALGVVYAAHKIELSRFLALVPNYVLEFGIGCSIEHVNGPLAVGGARLTDYEHEVCFLLAMNWDFKQIAHFMNKHRPIASTRSPDAIYKCRNRICEKLACHPAHLREMLVGMGIHQKMPNLFFRRLIGSRSL
ncbi:hypothetical protein Bsp3421_000576 (plasmid) [Burkholderia sp. FERM BP-3421]|jgi:hypothetical protein|uniref:hypothetical protein n=1 Tax=Burkholderia sp. FERM BP-3421 TaxID=1494466 RepID=UPI00235EF9FB|nr:hypothetical protein [Burkholderia sp. FERM BP-3421]WDD90708.1 hypothetical protein Bsp3421_000576 [Burkholderia sp. FERM BP-3421]